LINTLDTANPESETGFSMLETVQIVTHKDIWDVLRTPFVRDLVECAETYQLPLLPALEDLDFDGNLNRIQSGSTVAGYPPYDGDANLIPWSSTFAECPANGRDPNLIQLSAASVQQFAPEGNFAQIQIEPSPASLEYFLHDGHAILLQPTLRWSISPDGEITIEHSRTESNPWFDLGCNALASAAEALADYISESERKAREWLKRFYRKTILSSAVSKDGHLSFLVPIARETCVEAAARDHVVHLEVITLAEEEELPATSAVGQILNLGEESWKRWRSRLSNLFSKFSQGTLPSGYIHGGLNFASVQPL
jgi:hypothetical protein